MADGVSYPPGVSEAQVQAIMPQPSNTAPPGVTDSGATGTMTGIYALANHTHASKARKARGGVSASTFTWVYPTPFGAGVVPICNGIAETASGVTDLINVQIDGTPTNTQCVFRITRYQQSFLSLLGLNVLTFNSTPLSIQLHMSALEP